MIINQLPEIPSVQETDEIPVERGTTTYKSTLQKLKDLVASLLTKSDVGLGNVDNVRQYSAQNPPPYPVTSVNGQTGEVVLNNVTDLNITATAGSGVTIRSVNFHKIGRIAFGAIYFDVTSALTDGQDIATLSDSLPPPYGAYVIAPARSSTGTCIMAYIPKSPSNKIKAWGATPAGNHYYAQFIYVIQ